MSAEKKIAPGPRGHWLLGNLSDFRKDPLRLMLEAPKKFGDVVRLRVGPVNAYIATNPVDVQHVLQDNVKSFTKGTISYQRMKALLGEGLVTAEGPHWLRQRRLAQPAFHRDKVAGFALAMSRLAVEMVDGWAPRARDGQPLDVELELTGVTMKIVCATLFGAKVEVDLHKVSTAFTEASSQIAVRSKSFFEFAWLPTETNRRYKSAIGTLDEVVFRIIAERRKQGGEGDDLLSMFLQARDEDTGEGMTDRQLRDEVMTMFLAGHETTATALTWALYLLGNNPDEEQKLRDEVRAAIGDRPPELADLERMPRARRVIEESMRLYPPVWAAVRMTVEPEVLGGYPIKRGDLVFVSQYATQRLEKWWPDPERFDPDRFLPERSVGRHKYAWFPFLGGPRGCIGNVFAMMEAQLLLATVIQRWKLTRLDDRPKLLDPLVTLRPRGGLKMRVEAAS